VQPVALAVRFACELVALAGLAWWGAEAGDGVTAVMLALALPVAAGTVWGLWVAPRSERRLRDPARALCEALVFGAAAAALVDLGHAVAAAVFAAAALATAAITRRAATSR